MARTRDPKRFDSLVRAATEVFIRQGYARTQMSDVAEAVDVAKGTLYLYVESKEALFDAAVRHAGSRDSIEAPAELPVPTPKAGATVAYVQAQLVERSELPALSAALTLSQTSDAAGELEAVVLELYDLLHENRIGLKLVDRCAIDFPGLGAIYRAVAREGVPEALAQYIQSRTACGQFRACADPRVAGRMVIELATFWAVHVHWDPSPVPYDPDAVRSTLVQFVRGALLQ